ncbi:MULTISPECIES: acyl-CoA desaturase [unclassified Curtobacterium]|uniref:fatty acid desaturase family protein n=1 Tax=unclassified Curtobacterium TaxID=257496 RepID=UPI0008DCF8BA|nr:MULTISPECIES: acyl-CoA desaturase [unclassified Curtobacterium]OIH99553.1 delta fatty acid desaturase [Curtobacterium sp. MCBA15_003]OII30612.1 delta fatty acid desaturase [Curtobacterium sp. MMLR14_006]
MGDDQAVPTGYTRTGRRSDRTDTTSSYTALLARVRTAGLLGRRTRWYWGLIAVLTVLLVGTGGAFAVLGGSWWQLLVAGVLGVLFTQFAFLSHEAAHRQVFASQHWNDRSARYVGTFLTGVSYAWWTNKHTRHHANPNTVGKDPDISFDAISFRPEDAARRTGFLRVLVRVQGWAFFPMLLVEGVNLHWQSIRTYTRRGPVKHRWAEGSVFAARFVLYLGVVFWFLPVGIAFAFLGVQLAVFGFCMGIAFAPNHKGMPVIEPGRRVDFFSRQVLTSRDIGGGAWVEYFMGGLNHQVEHHLFPNMARPNLRAARDIVRRYCAEQGVPYTETTLVRSYVIVVRFLNEVGLAARDPFACPMVERLR